MSKNCNVFWRRSTILSIGFPNFTCQINQRIRCSATQLLWHVSLGFFFSLHEHFTIIRVKLTPVLLIFISRRRERFYKDQFCPCLQITALYSECSSDAQTSAANLANSRFRLCLRNLFKLSAQVLPHLCSVRNLVPKKITEYLPEKLSLENNCLRSSNSLLFCILRVLYVVLGYPQFVPTTDLSMGLLALGTRPLSLGTLSSHVSSSNFAD